MELKIKPSGIMNTECGWNESFENRIIRIPDSYRIIIEKSCREFVHLRTKNDSVITLQVFRPFYEDIVGDPYSAYVTDETLSKLILKRYEATSVEVGRQVTLGCDPEFFLVDRNTGLAVSAETILRNRFGEIGSDGYQAELRPPPSIYPEEIVKEIRALLTTLRNKYLRHLPYGENILMIGGSAWPVSSIAQLTAGFHLHFGLPKEILLYRKKRNIGGLLTRVLDNYVGIPSVTLEGQSDSFRRTSQFLKYGRPGDFRMENDITIEYRVPGGVNLKHPDLSLGLLALGQLVVRDFVSRLYEMTDGFANLGEMSEAKDLLDLYPNIIDPRTMLSIMCCQTSGPALGMIDKVYKDISMMVDFSNFSSAINNYFNHIINRQSFSPNIEDNWRSRIYESEHKPMDIFRSPI